MARSWCGQEPANRSNIDNRSPAALRQHLFHLVLKQEKQRLYIDSEDTVEVLFRLIDEQTVVPRYSCVVGCIIQMPKGLDRKWHDAACFIGPAEICPKECRTSSVAADVADQPPPIALTPPSNQYLRAQLDHPSRGGSANTTGSTIDECDLSGRTTVVNPYD